MPLSWLPGTEVPCRGASTDGAVDAVVLPGIRGLPVHPHLPHDLDALAQGTQPLARPGEAVAVGPPLVLVPAGADPHLDPSLGDDVDGGGDLGQVGRVAVRHAGAHLTQPDPPGDRGAGRRSAGVERCDEPSVEHLLFKNCHPERSGRVSDRGVEGSAFCRRDGDLYQGTTLVVPNDIGVDKGL